jgi:hypothetical protein
MGAHFALTIYEQVSVSEALSTFLGRIVAADAHGEKSLYAAYSKLLCTTRSIGETGRLFFRAHIRGKVGEKSTLTFVGNWALQLKLGDLLHLGHAGLSEVPHAHPNTRSASRSSWQVWKRVGSLGRGAVAEQNRDRREQQNQTSGFRNALLRIRLNQDRQGQPHPWWQS